MKNALFLRIKSKLKDQAGMTLVELLVSLTLAAIVMVTIMGVLMYQGLMSRNIQQTSILGQDAVVASAVMQERTERATEIWLHSDAGAFTPTTNNYFSISGTTLSHFVYDAGSFTETILTDKLSATEPSLFSTPFSEFAARVTLTLEKADLGIEYTTNVTLSFDNLVFANAPIVKDDVSETEFYILEYLVPAP